MRPVEARKMGGRYLQSPLFAGVAQSAEALDLGSRCWGPALARVFNATMERVLALAKGYALESRAGFDSLHPYKIIGRPQGWRAYRS